MVFCLDPSLSLILYINGGSGIFGDSLFHLAGGFLVVIFVSLFFSLGREAHRSLPGVWILKKGWFFAYTLKLRCSWYMKIHSWLLKLWIIVLLCYLTEHWQKSGRGLKYSIFRLNTLYKIMFTCSKINKIKSLADYTAYLCPLLFSIDKDINIITFRNIK